MNGIQRIVEWWLRVECSDTHVHDAEWASHGTSIKQQLNVPCWSGTGGVDPIVGSDGIPGGDREVDHRTSFDTSQSQRSRNCIQKLGNFFLARRGGKKYFWIIGRLVIEKRVMNKSLPVLPIRFLLFFPFLTSNANAQRTESSWAVVSLASTTNCSEKSLERVSRTLLRIWYMNDENIFMSIVIDHLSFTRFGFLQL